MADDTAIRSLLSPSQPQQQSQYLQSSRQPLAMSIQEVTRPIGAVDPPPHGATEPLKKRRGRQRLLQGLRRMASSTSLTRVGTLHTRVGEGYNGLSRGSMSCISLASPMPSSFSGYGSSCSSQDTANYSTAPTSLAATPPTGPDMRWMERNRIKAVSQTLVRSRPATPLTAPLPSDLRYGYLSQAYSSVAISESSDDYFSIPVETARRRPRRPNFNFWSEMPDELKIRIIGFMSPKDIIRASAVSKAWHAMCYDGQLWKTLDFSETYQQIPAESLVKILTEAGPFVQDLNLRGCVQMHERWRRDGPRITDLCRNVQFFSLKDCKIDRSTVHFFILRNPRLVHVDLSGVSTINNAALKILAQSCPQLQHLDVSWCPQIDTTGLHVVAQNCANLRDLRAGKTLGWNHKPFLLTLFNSNSLERLVVSHCIDLDDDSWLMLVQGEDPLIDPLTQRATVPPRRLRHIDLTGCKHISNKSMKSLPGAVPNLESLCLHGCISLTDDALVPLLPTVPRLTHLDLEELGHLTNETLAALSTAPCAPHLRHLSISYCEELSDTGVVPIIKACPRLSNIEVDNTRVGDLTLHEAAAALHSRNAAALEGNLSGKPELGLRLVAYDCANVTWTGILAILEKNAEFFMRVHGSRQPIYPRETINLKCFYGFQPTVDEHTKRVLRGELAKATILARKWHDWMQASEEAGLQGAGGWRRRRRAREAERQVEGEGAAGDGTHGRRRARSGGCMVM